MANYYDPADLKKFKPKNMGRVNEELSNKFFDYYGAAMQAGALSAREKALMALAIAHYAQCPYCIDAYTKASLTNGADEAQMTEAVHVAASMAAGITFVASVQMQNKIDELQ